MGKFAQTCFAYFAIANVSSFAAAENHDTDEYQGMVLWSTGVRMTANPPSTKSEASEDKCSSFVCRKLEEYKAKKLSPFELRLLKDFVNGGDFRQYYDHIKSEKMDDVKIFLDYWLPDVSDDTRFLSEEVFLCDPSDPKNHTFGAFKEALFKVIKTSELEVTAIPTTIDIDKFLLFKRGIEDKILCDITCFIAGMELSAGWYIIDKSVKFWDYPFYTECTGDSFISAIRKVLRGEIHEIFRAEAPPKYHRGGRIAEAILNDIASSL